MQNRQPTIIYAGIIISIAFWLIETSLHFWWFEPEKGFELWPSESNEQWMRCFILLLLIGFSIYAQYVQWRAVKIEQEKLATFKATMNTVMDIEGNFLNNLTLYQMELEDTQSLSPQSIAEIQQLINKTHERLRELAETVVIEEELVAGTFAIIKTKTQK